MLEIHRVLTMGWILLWLVGSWLLLIDAPANGQEPLRKLHLGKGHIPAMTYSPDGQFLAVAGPQSDVWLYDAISLDEVASIQGGGWDKFGHITPFAFSLGEDSVAVCGLEDVGLWDMAQGKWVGGIPSLAFLLGEEGWPEFSSVTFSPDGQQLITAAGSWRDGYTIHAWDVTGLSEWQPQLLVRLEGHQYPIGSLVVSPDGQLLASGSGARSSGGSVRLWDMAQHKALASFPTSDVYALDFRPDGRYLAAAQGADFDGSVTVYDVEQRTQVVRLGTGMPVHSVEYSPDGSFLVAATTNRVFIVGPSLQEEGTDFRLDMLRFIRNGALSPVVVDYQQSAGDRLTLYSLDGQVEFACFYPHGRLEVGLGYARFSPDGRTLLCVDQQGDATLWDWHRQLLSVAVHPQGKRPVTWAAMK